MSRKFKVGILFHLLISLIFLSSLVHAQDKAAEGIDMGFENAMKFGVFPRAPHFDALWNPAEAPARTQNYAVYFDTKIVPPLNMPLKGYGVLFHYKKHGFMLATDTLDASGALGFTDEDKTHELGYGYKLSDDVFVGIKYKLLQTDVRFSGGSFSMTGHGWDGGILLKPSDRISLEFLYLDMSTSLKWSTGTTEKAPSTNVIKATAYFLKNKALIVSPQVAVYRDPAVSDDKEFRLGASYRMKHYGAVRVVANDGGKFFLYGVTLHVLNVFLHYDAWQFKGISSATGNFISAAAGF